MKDFPSCLGETVVQIVSQSAGVSKVSSAAAPRNLDVTSVYLYHHHPTSAFITLTWIKHFMGQKLTLRIQSSAEEQVLLHLNTWLFSRRKGSKNSVLGSLSVDIHWDFSSAAFNSGPEPLQGFYLAIFFDQEPCLLLGDLTHLACKKMETIHGAEADPSVSSKAVLVAKREHIFGKRRWYSSRAQFGDIRIEHDAESESCDECLVIHVDGKKVMQVPRLKWNFRGNDTISVDGISIQVYWDVHNWLYESGVGNAVFLFRSAAAQSGHGFSLMLCAWKTD